MRLLNQNIVSEATCLTRAGQLVEATALLQRMLRGESAPDPSDTPVPYRIECGFLRDADRAELDLAFVVFQNDAVAVARLRMVNLAEIEVHPA
jgi:hypothetical protein